MGAMSSLFFPEFCDHQHKAGALDSILHLSWLKAPQTFGTTRVQYFFPRSVKKGEVKKSISSACPCSASRTEHQPHLNPDATFGYTWAESWVKEQRQIIYVVVPFGVVLKIAASPQGRDVWVSFPIVDVKVRSAMYFKFETFLHPGRNELNAL